jgi:ADP-ribose pyrophosphatase
MSDKARYFEFVQSYPERFANVPGGIEILLDPEEIVQAEAAVAQRLIARGLPAEWADVGVAFQDQYLLLLRDAVRFPDSTLGTYLRNTSMAEDIPGVIILPIYQGKVVLERHYRHGPRAWMLEIPRGYGDARYTPEENAQRELLEEIGAPIVRLEALGHVNVNSASIGGYDCLFYAEIASLGKLDVGEGISNVLLVDIEQFHEMIASGEITDGFTLSAYARARAKNLL